MMKSFNKFNIKLEDILNPLSYGVGQAKTWNELINEIESGECQINWENNCPIRLVQLVSVEIISPHGETLIEERQEFNDGRVRRRGLKGVSEKLQTNESPELAVQRALVEELGIKADLPLEFLGEQIEENESPSYPGLLSRYRKFCFRVQISEQFYRPEYIEIQENKRTFFIWKQ